MLYCVMWYHVWLLQRVAVCCSVLQCVAVCCSVVVVMSCMYLAHTSSCTYSVSLYIHIYCTHTCARTHTHTHTRTHTHRRACVLMYVFSLSLYIVHTRTHERIHTHTHTHTHAHIHTHTHTHETWGAGVESTLSTRPSLFQFRTHLLVVFVGNGSRLPRAHSMLLNLLMCVTWFIDATHHALIRCYLMTSTHCRTLQHTETHCNTNELIRWYFMTCDTGTLYQ